MHIYIYIYIYIYIHINLLLRRAARLGETLLESILAQKNLLLILATSQPTVKEDGSSSIPDETHKVWNTFCLNGLSESQNMQDAAPRLHLEHELAVGPHFVAFFLWFPSFTKQW